MRYIPLKRIPISCCNVDFEAIMSVHLSAGRSTLHSPTFVRRS